MAFSPFDDPSSDEVIADINVTPLVDVMLVLLIIFMITTPMLHQGVDVQLPEMTSAETLPLPEEDPVVLTVTRDQVVFVRDEPVHIDRLVERLLPELETRGSRTVFMKADRTVPFGEVTTVLDVLNQAGVTNVALVVEPARSRSEE